MQWLNYHHLLYFWTAARLGSITDAAFVNTLFDQERFEYVYHLAAYAAEGLSHFIKRFNYTNNLIGSVNLVNASVNHDVRCFVFTSSIAVYGTGELPLRETTTPKPGFAITWAHGAGGSVQVLANCFGHGSEQAAFLMEAT